MGLKWLAITILLFIAFPLVFPNIASYIISDISKNPDVQNIPYYIFRTMLRMCAAYFLVVLFALPYGIISGMYQKPANIMIPVIDVLQSVPVLAFMPAAFLFFINNFSGELGLEMASVLLIFTGMAWAVTIGVYGAVKNIPNEIKEFSHAYELTRWRYIHSVILPAIFPAFVTHSMLAWGGGWYFLIATEYMTFGSVTHTLPGIGYFLANSVYNLGSLPSAMLGLVILVALVYSINRFIWQALIDHSEKYKYESESFVSRKSTETLVLRIYKKFFKPEKEFLFSLFDKIDHALYHLIYRRHRDYAFYAVAKNKRERRYNPQIHTIGSRYSGFYKLLGAVIAIGIIFIVMMFLLGSAPQPIMQTLGKYPEAYNLPAYSLMSLSRICIAFIIALLWTGAAGFLIGRNKKLQEKFMPIFDIGQSIPALALFPFIVVLLIDIFGATRLSLEFASILLIMTGAQWYLLFNIIHAVKSIPTEIAEASVSFNYNGLRYIKNVLLPAIFPGVVVGSIQAFGGAWNASIVSEYIIYGGREYTVPGLGYFLDKAAWKFGDTTLIILTLFVMVATILIVNRLFWRNMFKLSEKYKLEY